MAEEEKKAKPQLPKSEVSTPVKVHVKNGAETKGETNINIGGIKTTNI